MYAFEQWILLFESPNDLWSNGALQHHEELKNSFQCLLHLLYYNNKNWCNVIFWYDIGIWQHSKPRFGQAGASSASFPTDTSMLLHIRLLNNFGLFNSLSSIFKPEQTSVSIVIVAHFVFFGLCSKWLVRFWTIAFFIHLQHTKNNLGIEWTKYAKAE